MKPDLHTAEASYEIKHPHKTATRLYLELRAEIAQRIANRSAK